MEFNSDFFLDNKKLLEAKDKTWFLFGMGEDFEALLSTLSDCLCIKGGFDNNITSKEYMGYAILPIELCTRDYVRKHILITTSKYYEAVSAQLQKHGLIPGVDFFVWDRWNRFIPDADTKGMIDWLSSNIDHGPKLEKEAKVLIPIENIHDIHVIVYAYVSEYLMKRFNAGVDAYIREGKHEVNNSVLEVYKAFGVERVLHHVLTAKQECAAIEITNKIWEGISDYSDWKSIEIFGINFGTSIIRTYLRAYEALFDPTDGRLREYLHECVRSIVFWYEWIKDNNYKTIILWDGVGWESFIRDIAISQGIPTYAMHYVGCMKMNLGGAWKGSQYNYYKQFWGTLNRAEINYALCWAKEKLDGVIRKKEMNKCDSVSKYLLSEKKGTANIVIFPHSLEDDSYMYGDHVFDNNYVSWLDHLGYLSTITPEYVWYIKPHIINSSDRDRKFIDDFLKKYSNIIRLPIDVSPSQLKELGVEWALTVQGSIGLEMPFVGIQVINAGLNPSMAFDFSFNPKTKDEYDSLILNLPSLKIKNKPHEVLQCYAMEYLLYDWDKKHIPWPFINTELSKDNYRYLVEGDKREVGSWKYRVFIEEAKEELVDYRSEVERIFKSMDLWSESIFYNKLN